MLINELPMVMFRCLFCTVVIELIVGFILKIRDKKDLLGIILVNFITNPIVVTIPVYFYIRFGTMYRNIALIILEIWTLLLEGYIYKKILDYKKINPFIISVILNASSYFIGEFINYIL